MKFFIDTDTIKENGISVQAFGMLFSLYNGEKLKSNEDLIDELWIDADSLYNSGFTTELKILQNPRNMIKHKIVDLSSVFITWFFLRPS